MTVLITGGNGFIGSHLAEELAEEEDVVLFDLKFGKNTKNFNYEKISGDICNYKDIKEAVVRKSVIFHFAAVSRVVEGQRDPQRCFFTNFVGTLNTLEALNRVNPDAVFFLGSSREVYGEQEKFPVREDYQKEPTSVYGVSKLAAENLCLCYRRFFDLRTVILRFSNVYGSERDILDRVVPKFILRALKGEPLTLYGGDQILDFTYIDDTIQGILRAYERLEDIVGEDFHFTTGKGTSIRKLAEMIKEMCNSSSKILSTHRKPYDVRRFIGSYEKSYKILGYEPKVPLREGLKRTIARLRNI